MWNPDLVIFAFLPFFHFELGVGVGGVVRLQLLPKAACLEGRCRGVARLDLLPKAAYLEGRCRGAVRLRPHILKDGVGGSSV